MILDPPRRRRLTPGGVVLALVLAVAAPAVGYAVLAYPPIVLAVVAAVAYLGGRAAELVRAIGARYRRADRVTRTPKVAVA